MNPELTPFLDEGLKKFPAARAAVAAFREEVSDRLVRVLEAAELTPYARSGPMKIEERSQAGYGTWICAWCKAEPRSGPAVYIDVGLWWDWLATKDACVYYANINNSQDVVPFEYREEVPGVSCAESRGEQFLYIPAQTVETLERDIKLVLAARLKQAT